jgi:hypothetical protein
LKYADYRCGNENLDASGERIAAAGACNRPRPCESGAGGRQTNKGSETVTSNDSAIDDCAPGPGFAQSPAPAGLAVRLKVPPPDCVANHDSAAAAASPRLPCAENDNATASESRTERPSSDETGRRAALQTPFAFALLLSVVWVAVVYFGNLYFSSAVQQILSAGGPVAIFSAMQFYASSNEALKARVRALNQERADAKKFDRMAQMAAKARTDIATLERAVDKAIDRSFALSKAVDAEVARLEGVCRESEGLLAGLIRTAVEAELRAVASHKQLQDAAIEEARKLQSLVGDVSTAFQTSGRVVIEEVKSTLDSARGAVEALFERKTGDLDRSFGARVKQLGETLSTREEAYHSRLESFGLKLVEIHRTSTQTALDAIGRAGEAFSGQLVRDGQALAATIDQRAEDIRGALRVQATAMEEMASTVKSEVERLQKTVVTAFAEIEPSLSETAGKLLTGVAQMVAANTSQIDESVAAFLAGVETLHNQRQDRLESAMADLAGKVASSSGQIGVSFDVQSADFLNKLDGRVEALRDELDERKRVIQEFLTTTRASLSEDVLTRLRAFEQGIQNQASTLNSALSVRLADIDVMLSRLSDQLLFELGAAINKLKGELPAQTEAFAREIASAGALVDSKAGEMAQTLELASSVFLDVLEKKAGQLDKAIVEGGSALVAKFEESAARLSEALAETTHAVDTDFKRNSADVIAALTTQADDVELGFNKTVQSAIDHLGSQIDFLMEALTNSVSRMDQLIRIDGGQLTEGLDERAKRAGAEFQATVDQLNALFEGRAEGWATRVSESSSGLVRDVEATLDSFDGRVEQKSHEVFESIARLTVRLQNGLDLKAGILNEMLGRRAAELSKIIGTMIDGYANPDGLGK